jgi:hypothetical protein
MKRLEITVANCGKVFLAMVAGIFGAALAIVGWAAYRFGAK